MLKTIPELVKQASANVRRITAQQAQQEMAEKNALFIDVREPAEHLKEAVSGSINIPRGVLEMQLLEREKDPKRPIYLHCATSGRATFAAEQLARVGYEDVTVISCKFSDICQAFN
ncbi:rhodanese-like domain-containing protein [Thalassotalea mangrovi]|uniref:Rhodanese-like domain-containing protein n=1 Tax=Thalassotalea mangrovi TaxID=2572245 RepID=A0A4V5NWG7_9GAMM|nr:rhodanese-like domain-containing protein [Thalassotalea mangrovi]TKB43463.1 rhodanese-like domain-containing protein [Thalassotalea mangrovi]